MILNVNQMEPPPHPQYPSSSQPQPPQSASLVEQAILNLTKLVGDFVEEQKTINAKLRQRIDTVESCLNQKLDVLQSDLDQKIDILHNSISRLTNQHVHQEEESPEEECLSNTMVEEQCLQQLQEGLIENFESSNTGVVVYPWEKKEETSPMLTEEGVEGMQWKSSKIIIYTCHLLTKYISCLHQQRIQQLKHLLQRPSHLYYLPCKTSRN